jgi:protein SCO1/2
MRRVIVEEFDRTRPRKSLAALLAAAALCLACNSAAAQGNGPRPAATATAAQQQQQQRQQSPAPARPAQPSAAAPSAAQSYFTDTELVNQNGEKMRLYSDLLKGKVIVINFFFATCQGSCLPMSRNLQQVRAALGDRMGKDVHFISISVDPAVDTPAALKEYARKLDAGPGWYFLTGEKAKVDFALRKLGQYVDNPEQHTNVFIIGNERTGLWKKAFGLARPDELIKVVESVLNDKPAGGS